MAKSRKECLDDIARRTGRSRRDVDELVGDLDERAQGYERDGTDQADAYTRARDEMIDELAERSARARRENIMNTRKNIMRLRFYKSAAEQIDKMPIGDAWKGRLKRQAARLGFEAKLVGINLPIYGNRKSVDAQYVAFRRMWLGGFASDLNEAGLLKIFASGEKTGFVENWTAELFELNKRPSAAYQRAMAAGEAGGRERDELGWRGEGPGNPGITKDAQALQVAKIVQKWQRESINALNQEGAWVRSYSGYITRTSHNSDAIGEAGAERWIADTLPLLDLGRTFGTKDPQRVRDALFEMWTPMMQGDHFDYGKPIDEPLYPNTAKSSSASRELHFRDAAAWRKYNETYGVHNATHTVVQALMTAARRTALMREFGTRPREAYEADKGVVLGHLQAESKGRIAKLNALEQAAESAGADATVKAKLEGQIADLRKEIAQRSGDFNAFKDWLVKLDNRFAQIDGSSMKPIDRAKANTVANIMSVQRTSKLGNIFATHVASLPTKAAEARYWGIPFAERYRSLFSGFTQGMEGTAKREAVDLTLVAAEHQLGHFMNAYDVADAPAGWMTKHESTFFTLTGVNAVIDNQRGGFEAMAAAHLGSKRQLDWAGIGRKEQRVVQGFGVDEAMWKALKGVEWTEIDGRTYLFPSDAMKLSDDQVRAYLKEANARELGRVEPNAEDIAKGRRDLAMTLAATYSDRGGYAIPMPSARIRAMLFGKDYEPGTSWNMAKKLFWQFKIWPADMITRAWEREIYGTIGDSGLHRAAGWAEMAVGAIAFGIVAEGLRDIIKGHDPLEKLRQHPFAAVAAAAQRSGMGSIVGDFLLGQFDRHGMSAAASMLGPTFGQIDDLAELIHAGGRTKEGMFSDSAMRERAATLLKMVKSNTPGMNLWLTHHVTDALIWHRLQEWINPGYLARTERRMRDLQGTKFIVSPAKTDAWLTGHRASPL